MGSVDEKDISNLINEISNQISEPQAVEQKVEPVAVEQAVEPVAVEQTVESAEVSAPAKPKATLRHKILTAIGLVFCAVFCLLLACNLTIIIKGSLYPEKPPSVLSITPMVVLSGSMSGDAPDHIEIGDLIFVGKADPEKLKVGDIISFMQHKSVTTHRIIEIKTNKNGDLLFYTKGDFNNAPDSEPVTVQKLVGIYKFRIPKVGDLALFAQSPLGMIIFIGVPLLAFIVVDTIRRQRQKKKQKLKNEDIQAELARLRLLAEQSEKANSDTN